MTTLCKMGDNLWRSGSKGLYGGVSRMKIPLDRLVLYAPLWHPELSGSPFISKDSYARSCTVTGAVWGTTGRTFAGGNDLITIATKPFAVTSAFTLLAWVNYGIDDSGTFYGQGKSTALYPAFKFFANSSMIALSGKNDANGDVAADSNAATVTVGTPALIGVSFDGSSTHRLYKDGVGYATTADTFTGITDTTNLYTIGVWKRQTSVSYFTGVIGELLIYTRLLADAEVQNIYLATKWRYQ